MRIRILTSRDGHPCGAVVDVADALAAAWVGAGDAERVAPEPKTETAAAAPVVETAMKAKAKGR